jgi:hypothetical protein
MERIDKLKLAVKKGFTYCENTGLIKTPSNKTVTNKSKNGYIRISLWSNGKRHYLLGHQFAWFVMYNETVTLIDHKNRIKTDNCKNNLRSITKSQNAMNMSNNKGYTYCSRSKKYIAIIMVNYRKKHLGVFDNPDDAKKCYDENKNKHHIINK